MVAQGFGLVRSQPWVYFSKTPYYTSVCGDSYEDRNSLRKVKFTEPGALKLVVYDSGGNYMPELILEQLWIVISFYKCYICIMSSCFWVLKTYLWDPLWTSVFCLKCRWLSSVILLQRTDPFGHQRMKKVMD